MSATAESKTYAHKTKIPPTETHLLSWGHKKAGRRVYYQGLADTTFKESYGNHKSLFNNENSKNSQNYQNIFGHKKKMARYHQLHER